MCIYNIYLYEYMYIYICVYCQFIFHLTPHYSLHPKF